MKRHLMIAAALMACLIEGAIANGDATNPPASVLIGILPKGWTVTSKTNAVPYNLSIEPGKPKGTCLTFVGTATVGGPRGINPQKESYLLWIMQPDYVPMTPDTDAQFREARLLGTNANMSVYWTTFTTGTPSWEHWQQDIVQKLDITRPNTGMHLTTSSVGSR